MSIFLVTIHTEDGEKYMYPFCQKPSETKMKSLFFKINGHTYSRKDWKKSIWYEMVELDIIM